MNLWQFISQGGLVRTASDNTVNNIVLLANTLPYPITGKVQWSQNYSTSLTWDTNGNPQDSANNVGMTLLPLASFINYFTVANTTLANTSNLAQWQANNNIYT